MALVLIITTLSLTGCLVIGGKTHICANDKEYKEKIARLENRIQTLEQYAGIAPPTEQKNEISIASLDVEKKF